MNPLTQSKNATILLVLIALTLGCFGFSPQAQAVCQEGCDLVNHNTFLGDDTLINSSIGFYNTATGFEALTSNTGGFDNTATGAYALLSNTIGNANTATGIFALYSNTRGYENTAIGLDALFSNTSGNDNTATGSEALSSNATGESNTATGAGALGSNTTGCHNTANGADALAFNTTGNNNIALGEGAGTRLSTGSNNVEIGNTGVFGESNKIRIGNGTHTDTFIAGITGVTVANGVGVIIDTRGHLGTVVSSARYKEAIEPMNASSEAILSLQPVRFRYKKELDPEGIPQFGLVAEEVAKVDSDLVARDDQGKPYTVRYEAVNAMLLNEFLKEHRGVQDLKNTVTKQEATIAQQQKEIQALTATLKEQAAQIQKVSDQLKTQAPAPRVVANN